jgi:hypothetical protein
MGIIRRAAVAALRGIEVGKSDERRRETLLTAAKLERVIHIFVVFCGLTGEVYRLGIGKEDALSESPVLNVSDTARWIAAYRASESVALLRRRETYAPMKVDERSCTARRRAARASRRVESSVGSTEFASFMMSGISVQPSTTASQASSFRRPMIF